MFARLGWKKKIRSLGDFHIPFNSSPDFEFVVENQSSDDYKLTPFSQSTQAWRWRVQEEHKQYENFEKRQVDLPEKDFDLNEDKPNGTEHEVKVVGKSLKTLSFCKRMTLHCCPLKDRMRDKIVSYMDFL